MPSPRPAYALDKLTQMVRHLATGAGDARQRVCEALEIGPGLLDSDFPPPHRERWEQIKKKATKFGPLCHDDGRVYRSSLENTMNRVKNATAAKIAKEMYDLYWAMSENEEWR